MAAAFVLPALTIAVHAADITPPVYKAAPLHPMSVDWTGLYAGLNVGGGFDTSNFANHGSTVRSRGVLAGVTAGINYQTGKVVWGLEADIDWSDASGSLPCGNFTCTAKNDWISTLRGRTGYTLGRWLPYLTAGAAYGRVTSSSTDPALPAMSRDRLGWTAGLGIEYAIGGNWSAKLEYLYACLGEVGGGSVCKTSVTTDNISMKESILRVGLDYKFSGPMFPPR